VSSTYARVILIEAAIVLGLILLGRYFS